MRKILTPIVATLAFAACAVAGTPMVSSSKSYKEAKTTTAPEPTCFSNQELQLDTFGAYAVGEGPNQVQLFRDHGWGGGVGVNYFFARHFGIGADATWLYAKQGPGATEVEGDHTTLHNFTGSLILRYPIDSLCLAPYLFTGGGFSVDGDQWATAHVGVGIEYRLVPHKIGLFTDGRWTYLGDRFGHEDLNFFTVRAGVRVVF